MRSASRQRSASRTKGGKPGKGGKNPKKTETPPAVPSPFAPYPVPQSLAPWPAPDSASSAVPALASMTSPQAAPNLELINALKKAYPEGLPQEVQEVIDKTSDTTARQLTKDLHSATTALGRARKSYRDAQAAETAHRQAWLRHLKEATKQWEDQLDQYRRKQSQFQEAKIKAGQEVEAARKMIQSLNSQTTASGTTAPMEDFDDVKPGAGEAQEEEDLKQSLQNALIACAEATGLQVKKVDEIQIHSDGEEAEQQRKRSKAETGAGAPTSS